MLHPCIICKPCTVLNNTPRCWKHMPISFYVNTPSAFIGFDTNFQRFNRMIKPLALMLHAIWRLIEFALAPFVQPPACSANLQADFNEMSLQWRGPRPRRWTCRQKTHPKPNGRSESQHPTADLARKGGLWWSILSCCNKLQELIEIGGGWWEKWQRQKELGGSVGGKSNIKRMRLRWSGTKCKRGSVKKWCGVIDVLQKGGKVLFDAAS